MSKTIIHSLLEITANNTYVIDSNITVDLSNEAYEAIDMYTFPENVTLIFTGAGFLSSNKPFRLRGNDTKIIADPVPIFGSNLDVTGTPVYNILRIGYNYSKGSVTRGGELISTTKENINKYGLDPNFATSAVLQAGDVIDGSIHNDGGVIYTTGGTQESTWNTGFFQETSGSSINGWISEYFYPEWFESDSDDDSIIINKALRMNCIYLGERYCERDLYLSGDVINYKNDPIYTQLNSESDPNNMYRGDLDSPGYSHDYRQYYAVDGVSAQEDDEEYDPTTSIYKNGDWNNQIIGSHNRKGFVKLLNKTYNIENPLILKACSLTGSGIGSTIINCSTSGNWDIKRCVYIGGDWGSPHVYIWKRAAIMLPTMFFTSNQQNAINISNFSLNLNGNKTHGMILERVQDNSHIYDINISNVRQFYSALKIEPAAVRGYAEYTPETYHNDNTNEDIPLSTWGNESSGLFDWFEGEIVPGDGHRNWKSLNQQDHFHKSLQSTTDSTILCDASYKPIPFFIDGSPNPFYGNIVKYTAISSYTKDNGVRQRRLDQLSTSAHNEGISIERVYATRWTGNDADYTFILRVVTNNGSTTTYKIYGAFPTNHELETELVPGSQVSEYELFTPHGGNAGMLYLNSVNETTINTCGFSPTPSNIYNYASGVAIELVNCSRINVTNSGAGFCRIGCLIKSIASSSNGINFTDNIYEGLTQYIVATKHVGPGSINYINIKGANYLDSGQASSKLSYSTYYIDGGGGYHNIQDIAYVPLIRLKSLSTSGNYILKRLGQPNIEDVKATVRYSNSSQVLDPTETLMVPGDAYGDCMTQLLNENINNLVKDENDIPIPATPREEILVRIWLSLRTPEETFFNTALPDKTIVQSTDGTMLSKNGVSLDVINTDTVTSIVNANMNKYLLKNEANAIVTNNFVSRIEFTNIINYLLTHYPEYDISFENNTIVFRRNGIIIQQFSLPYVMLNKPKIIDTVGLESCLGKSIPVNK